MTMATTEVQNLHPAEPVSVQTEALSDFARRAQDVLSQRIRGHLAQTEKVLDRIDTDQPRDLVASASAMSFDATESGVVVRVGDYSPDRVHTWAMGQLGDRVGLPRAFAASLTTKERKGWGPGLLAENLRTLYRHDPGRYLFRSVGGELRGFLSDRYKRMDARPLVAAFLESVQAIGAFPYESHFTDTRIALKAIVGKPVRLSETEVVALGAMFGTSDFGNGPVEVSLFAERLVCINGLVLSRDLRKAHVGGKLSDDHAWSQRTMELDTQTTASAIRDVVRGQLSAESQEKFVSIFRSAAEEAVAPESISTFLRSALTKDRAKQVVDTFTSADVTMLPAGQTRYRLSQAISLVANRLGPDATDERIELQRLAGKALEGE